MTGNPKSTTTPRPPREGNKKSTTTPKPPREGNKKGIHK